MNIERNEMVSGEDSVLEVDPMPFTLATRDANARAKLGCEAPALELSAPVPPPPSL